MMTLAARSLAVAPLVALAACGASRDIPVPQLVKPYRMEIQQGNFISREMVEQLKPGMTKEQVRFILGTPLVTDMFHADRWDYVYWREPVGGGKREQRTFSVVFEQGRLARVFGDLLPGEATAGVKPAAPKPEAPKPEPAKPAAEAAKPAADETPRQNWSAASDQPEPKPEPAPQAEEKKPEEKSGQPGFFGRLREKLGL